MTARRTQDMLRRHADGETLQEIANTYGVSRERVRQILKTAGAEMRGSGRRRGRSKVSPQKREAPIRWPKRQHLIPYAGKE